MREHEPTRTTEEQVGFASAEIEARLRSAGADLTGEERPQELARLLDAVERFEAAVRELGGDLMVHQHPAGETREPDDPRFVLPRRAADDTVTQYHDRILKAAERLR